MGWTPRDADGGRLFFQQRCVHSDVSRSVVPSYPLLFLNPVRDATPYRLTVQGHVAENMTMACPARARCKPSRLQQSQGCL